MGTIGKNRLEREAFADLLDPTFRVIYLILWMTSAKISLISLDLYSSKQAAPGVFSKIYHVFRFRRAGIISTNSVNANTN
jgi:hypothetical protein